MVVQGTLGVSNVISRREEGRIKAMARVRSPRVMADVWDVSCWRTEIAASRTADSMSAET